MQRAQRVIVVKPEAVMKAFGAKYKASTLPALALVGLVAVSATGANAQPIPGTIGNAGRMPETMSPGVQPPPSMPAPTPSPTIQPYPNTQSLGRDRVESRGYQVKRMEQRNDGSWKVDTTRNSVPTLPKGVPRTVTIHPDGRIVEEY